MSTIVTRTGKGSPLSYVEMDTNLTNLNTDKLEASDLAPYETLAHAAATYETIADAAATYETQAHATATFATIANLALTDAEVATKQDALPSQTGNNGKYLGTDGTNLSWNTVDALPTQTGHAGEFLITNGTVASWTTAGTGDVTLTGVQTLTNKTLTTPDINTSLNFTGSSGTIQVAGVDRVVIDSGGIASGYKTGSIPTAALATPPVNNVAAWCKFNGATAGTNAPIAGNNVATVTRNSAGNYTINFSSALASANYAISFIGTNSGTAAPNFSVSSATAPTTTAVTVVCASNTGTALDTSFGFISIIL